MKRSLWIILALAAVLGMLLMACAQPTPETVEKIKEVTKVVEKTVVVPEEKVVKETVVVEKEVPAEKGVVTVLGVWGGDELTAFQEAVFPFTDETDIGMAFEGTRDLAAVLTTRVEAGNPPDLAILPNPGQMEEFASRGELVDISTFMDMDKFQENYSQSWIDLGSYEGKLYGILVGASNKSLIWYNPTAFEAAGYEIPTTWDEMIALSDQIVADGTAPWCIGVESGAASGWPATDWIEDIMLRTAGTEVYDQWVAHEIPWTDPAIKTAWETFGQIVRNEDYVFGGTTGVLSTNFGESPLPLFDDPPGCYLHRQASFITGFFPEGVEAGTDYDFFPFPPIEEELGTPVLGGANVIVMFNDTPNARALMQYLASPKPHEILAEEIGWLSPNRGASLDAYPDDLTRKAAKMLVEAAAFRFDASDLMPAAVGSGTFWNGTLDYIGGTDLDSVLEQIETSAVDAYGK